VTLKAFLFLFVVTIVAVVASAFIAERLVGPGLERGVIIAVLAGLVVFPAARWAEYRGWIKGTWSPGGELRKAQDARKAREAEEARAAQEAPEAEPIAAGTDRTDPPAGAPPSPGDPR
jgi:hypothetical protein